MSNDLYNSVKWQNSIIQDQMKKIQDVYSTDKQKIRFLNQDLEWYSYISFILWIIYYFMCFVMAYFIFFGSKGQYTSMMYKCFMIAFIFLYPVFITPLEMYLINIWQYIRAYFTGSIYANSRAKSPPLSVNQLYPSLHKN
jgi:hypothetical protein